MDACDSSDDLAKILSANDSSSQFVLFAYDVMQRLQAACKRAQSFHHVKGRQTHFETILPQLSSQRLQQCALARACNPAPHRPQVSCLHRSSQATDGHMLPSRGMLNGNCSNILLCRHEDADCDDKVCSGLNVREHWVDDDSFFHGLLFRAAKAAKRCLHQCRLHQPGSARGRSLKREQAQAYLEVQARA